MKKQFYENYIITCITDYKGNAFDNKRKAVSFLKERFESEYGWRIQQVGQFKAMQDWLQGLAIDIYYYNYDIIELAKNGGSLPDNPTEKQEEKIINNYWSFMASKCLKLINTLNTKRSIYLD